jgi:multiple sugar transport system substrate-binding protein
MKRYPIAVFSLVVVFSLLLVACGGGATTTVPSSPVPATDVPDATEAATPEPGATAEPTVDPNVTPTLTPYPIATAEAGKIQVRWFIGLGTGTDPVQIAAEEAVVEDFNASQDRIQLVLEIVPFASAKDTLSTEIAAGNAPDIVGPVGWGGSNAFFGQWLDLQPLIDSTGYDTSGFNQALVSMYQTGDQGTVGLPFAVFPSAMFYNKALFDEAGLNYPPAAYGEMYVMPDGSEVEWSWDTVAEVSKLLTVDVNGKNATEPDFDKTQIIQYGYTWQYENHPSYWGSFWDGGSMLADDGTSAQVPDSWRAAWQWTYDGIWGDQPFIGNQQVEGSADFANGNPFNSGKVAMTDQPVWYTCCMNDVKDNLDAGAMPSYNGEVAGRIDADTFRIMKGSKNPEAAFEVLTYLVGEGVQKLIIGTADNPPAYGAVPSRAADQQPWLDAKMAQFPSVTNWDVVLAGLDYPDVPSAEGYMPNFNEAWERGNTFASLVRSTGDIDLDAEIDTYLADLTAIFAK